MELKKKTIIWEDNNEPPKDYIWVKSDNKAYEYSIYENKWVETKSLSGGSSSEDGTNTQLEEITITENGVTTAEVGKGYSKITINVPYVQKNKDEFTYEDLQRYNFSDSDINRYVFPDLFSENVVTYLETRPNENTPIITGHTFKELKENGAETWYYDGVYSIRPSDPEKLYFTSSGQGYQTLAGMTIVELTNQDGETVYGTLLSTG